MEKRNLNDINLNPFQQIGKDWLLISAGNITSFNTMTASWGGLGVLWHKNVATIYIRPQRYTMDFIEKNDYFSLSFLPPEHKDILKFCGAHSGRDTDKTKETGLQPLALGDNAVGYEQANLMLKCRKLYQDTIKADYMFDKEIDQATYPNKDYHYMIIGEIEECWSSK